MNRMICNVAMVVSLCGSLGQLYAGSVTYDLKNDWSTSQNPNGAWSYLSGSALLPYVANVTGSSPFPIGTFPFGTPVSGWSDGYAGTWVKDPGGPYTIPVAHDALAGDIVAYNNDDGTGPATSVRWTSDTAGVVNISGDVWAVNNLGRSHEWSLYENGTLLTKGDYFDGGVYSRSNPFEFSTGSGGASILQNIVVSAGDEFTLSLTNPFGGPGDFSGVNFTVDLSASPVPEPTTFALLSLGAVGLAFGAYRRSARTAA